MSAANKVTLARIALVPFMIAFMLLDGAAFPWAKFAAVAIFIIAASTDMLDGYLARKKKEVSPVGILLDPIADKLLVCSALIILTSQGKVHALVVLIIIMREFAVSGLRLVAAGSGHEIIAASWLGKTKTITQMVAIGFYIADNFPFSYWNIPFAQIIMAIALVFTLWSAVDYFKGSWSYLSEKKMQP
ncbi:CDP-diacylglycerol--glycerol-3-phosphate 3-phosphatidyltransferase [Christensenellaceae bacterium NSJ-44]|uniref:CDP-diacylglycerol--glycerol-3-phosphate 3-phosphatidyltransferase n=1 Tax=Luoshenia tenuis TaxID=2763654 RepID=A0A926CYE3_9FIRM|nr:CDP-diacylglycerol--glycerol-3-phosphate 3-phosphatidyltransferase [Luoshenia tenuis]MBC8529000.1 CDP-diacylglycerol--glycerol-3-phosphate 3-phosphatidyltransferase [Luoshenia tenuis]